MPARLDHVALLSADLERAVAFYDVAFAAAGIGRVVAFQDVEDADEVGEEAVGFGTEGAVVLWLLAARRATSGAHISLRLGDAATVDAVGTAVGTGARRRELDRPGWYGLSLTDPDGNTVEFFTILADDQVASRGQRGS